MCTSILLTSLINILVTRLAVSAASDNALFDTSPRGQAEWRRFCSDAATSTSEILLPHACFTIHDDINAAAHSSSLQKLGFASESGHGEQSASQPLTCLAGIV